MADTLIVVPPGFVYFIPLPATINANFAEVEITDVFPPELIPGQRAWINVANARQAGGTFTLRKKGQDVFDDASGDFIEFDVDLEGDESIGETEIVIGGSYGDALRWQDIYLATGSCSEGGSRNGTFDAQDVGRYGYTILGSQNQLIHQANDEYGPPNQVTGWPKTGPSNQSGYLAKPKYYDRRHTQVVNNFYNSTVERWNAVDPVTANTHDFWNQNMTFGITVTAWDAPLQNIHGVNVRYLFTGVDSGGTEMYSLRYDLSTEEFTFYVKWGAGGGDFDTYTTSGINPIELFNTWEATNSDPRKEHWQRMRQSRFVHCGFMHNIDEGRIYIMCDGDTQSFVLANNPQNAVTRIEWHGRNGIGDSSLYGWYGDVYYVNANLFPLDPTYNVPEYPLPASWITGPSYTYDIPENNAAWYDTVTIGSDAEARICNGDAFDFGVDQWTSYWNGTVIIRELDQLIPSQEKCNEGAGSVNDFIITGGDGSSAGYRETWRCIDGMWTYEALIPAYQFYAAGAGTATAAFIAGGNILGAQSTNSMRTWNGSAWSTSAATLTSAGSWEACATAVGDLGAALLTGNSVTNYWNGTTWSTSTAPSVWDGTGSVRPASFGRNAEDVMQCASGGGSEHWDGTAWSTRQSSTTVFQRCTGSWSGPGGGIVGWGTSCSAARFYSGYDDYYVNYPQRSEIGDV